MQKIFTTAIMVLAICGFSFTRAHAQETTIDTLKQQVEKLNADVETIGSDVDILKRLKISAYVQAQFQIADTAGASTFSGGGFPARSDQRFQIRRGRIKLAYDSPLGGGAIQLNASEKGVNLKDAYVYVNETLLNTFKLTLGAFDRPFGFEVAYSSSSLESPERARVNQTLFPGESDLGAMLTAQLPKTSRFNFIKLDAGLFSGNGVNSETDKKVDFIGRLSMAKANRSETFKYGFGVSYYDGYNYQGTANVYSMGKLQDGSQGFIVNNTASNKGAFAKRTYVGFDAQFSVESPMGISQLRGEYIQGTQPANKGSNASPSTSDAAYFDADTYIRKINGGYVIFIQNIGQSKHQFVAKYDWYDPNTGVAGKDIKTSAGLSKTDIKFSTIGLGWNYRISNNLKFTAFYDIVKNETTSVSKYDRDVKDNVLTLRIQAKF